MVEMVEPGRLQSCHRRSSTKFVTYQVSKFNFIKSASPRNCLASMTLPAANAPLMFAHFEIQKLRTKGSVYGRLIG